jgi:MFS family permease
MRRSARQAALRSMAAPSLAHAMPAPADRRRAARFARVTAANFFFFLTFASFFLLPLHVRALGGSERTIGLVMGTSGLSGLASIVAVGVLLDRFGRRVFLLGGFATMALASAAFLFVDRIGPALFVLRGVQGLAFAAGFNAASTLAVEFAPPGRRAAALGVFGVSTLATHALAPALGEQLIQRGGFPALFVAAAACSFVAVAIAWRLPGGAPLPAERGVPLRASAELSSAIATVSCCGVAFGGVITYVPTFVHDAALGPVATFFLSYTAAAVLTRITAGGLGDTLGRRTVILPALALLTISIVMLAAVRSAPALAVAGVLFGTAQGFVYPTLNAFAIDQAESGQLGRAQTLYNGAFNLGVTAGSVALGPIAEAFGHRVMFLCAAAMAASALAVFAVGAWSAGRVAKAPAGR